MPKTATKKTETKTKALRAHQKKILSNLVKDGEQERVGEWRDRGYARLEDLGLVKGTAKVWRPTAAGKKLAATFV